MGRAASGPRNDLVAMFPMQPLNPVLHAAYASALQPPIGRRDPLPPHVRQEVMELLQQRATVAAADLDLVDRKLVAALWWYVLRPDEIARRFLRYHRIRRPIAIAHATLVIAALGEAGYPVHAGVPTYRLPATPSDPPEVRGQRRDAIVWASAAYWARYATRRYVSFADRRGWMPRVIQHDESGTMHPEQRAALTLGPVRDATGTEHDYVRRHTRLLVLVRADGAAGEAA